MPRPQDILQLGDASAGGETVAAPLIAGDVGVGGILMHGRGYEYDGKTLLASH